MSTWSIDPKTGNAARNYSPALVPQRGRDLRPLPCATGPVFRRLGSRPVGFPTRTLSRHSPAGSIMPTVRCSTRSTTTVHSSRARCSPRASPAAIATSRTAQSCALPDDGVCLQCHDSEQVRRGIAPPSYSGKSGSCVLVMPYAHPHIHGRRPAARPQLSHSTARSVGEARYAKRLQRLSSDKTPQWAASAVERWHGAKRKGFQNYVGAFDAAWQDKADAARLLAAVAADGTAPPIARAGALVEMSSRLSSSTIELARSGLSNFDPMVRIAALDMLDGVPAAQVWTVVAPLLSDAVRGVRIRAVSLLAGASDASRPPGDRERFDRAAEEFIAAQRSNADRPESRSSLGSFLMRSGHAAEAENEYKAALRLSPQYVPASINLADLYRQLGRETEGESALRCGSRSVSARCRASPRSWLDPCATEKG